MPTPQIRLIGVDNAPVIANTLPQVGPKVATESLPVVLAQGISPLQSYVAVPLFDSSTPAKIDASIILIVSYNPSRRYLKIINNGPGDIELWTTNKPTPSIVGQSILRGEVLPKNGGGLAELGERISAIYATASQVASGLMVLEG